MTMDKTMKYFFGACLLIMLCGFLINGYENYTNEKKAQQKESEFAIQECYLNDMEYINVSCYIHANGSNSILSIKIKTLNSLFCTTYCKEDNIIRQIKYSMPMTLKEIIDKYNLDHW